MTTASPEPAPLLDFEVASDLSVKLEIGGYTIIGILTVTLLGVAWWFWGRKFLLRDLEFDAAEFGFGSSKFQFTPNAMDRQIAYAIWVELSTRKIGLEIDLEHDVITEVYNSWYEFFGVTRNLIKEVPAHKLKQKGTRAIVKTSVHVLNDGLRPHLTRWQARFRRWFEAQEINEREPQVVQTEFPAFKDLSDDLLAINAKLIVYRKTMYELATGEKEIVIDIENESK
ncbi:hypothetical protein [Ruegeria sp.]|uniref:hypothetical protein n=1 Tax=Ruegeria sp. TaxID=1879320 RepID=UPI00231C4F14|nr:hypothetical protein [Ruegeria sp.]MDA7967216.1 hypothetical protein [Ruegeria sp.]